MGSIGPMYQIMSFLLISNFEFRVNQESYGFFGVIIEFFIQKNKGLENKILSRSILDAQ